MPLRADGRHARVDKFTRPLTGAADLRDLVARLREYFDPLLVGDVYVAEIVHGNAGGLHEQVVFLDVVAAERTDETEFEVPVGTGIQPVRLGRTEKQQQTTQNGCADSHEKNPDSIRMFGNESLSAEMNEKRV